MYPFKVKRNHVTPNFPLNDQTLSFISLRDLIGPPKAQADKLKNSYAYSINIPNIRPSPSIILYHFLNS